MLAGSRQFVICHGIHAEVDQDTDGVWFCTACGQLLPWFVPTAGEFTMPVWAHSRCSAGTATSISTTGG